MGPSFDVAYVASRNADSTAETERPVVTLGELQTTRKTDFEYLQERARRPCPLIALHPLSIEIARHVSHIRAFGGSRQTVLQRVEGHTVSEFVLPFPVLVMGLTSLFS